LVIFASNVCNRHYFIWRKRKYSCKIFHRVYLRESRSCCPLNNFSGRYLLIAMLRSLLLVLLKEVMNQNQRYVHSNNQQNADVRSKAFISVTGGAEDLSLNETQFEQVHENTSTSIYTNRLFICFIAGVHQGSDKCCSNSKCEYWYVFVIFIFRFNSKEFSYWRIYQRCDGVRWQRSS
jgi:hypothetical protein